MKEIVKGVFTEKAYTGVVLGAIALDNGMVLIDAPPRAEDGKTWLKEISKVSPGPERILITLDCHPDRSLGTRAMECIVIAHEKALEIYKQRPTIFKGQNGQSGAEWEENGGVNGIRWLTPHITFSDHTRLHGSEMEVLVEHHPGPEPGASWVILPEQGYIFVGDTVMVKQPPFLANADLDTWIESLDLLMSKEYKDYRLISSRGGTINEKVTRNMRRYLADLKKRLDRLGRRKAKPDDLEKLIPRLLSACESPSKYKRQHTERLHYGLFHYYAQHYYPISSDD